jgi:hypothetical protein
MGLEAGLDGTENIASTGIQSPYRPDRSQSLSLYIYIYMYINTKGCTILN